jgi:hypothetical protein
VRKHVDEIVPRLLKIKKVNFWPLQQQQQQQQQRYYQSKFSTAVDARN